MTRFAKPIWVGKTNSENPQRIKSQGNNVDGRQIEEKRGRGANLRPWYCKCPILVHFISYYSQ
jgi:hypothetical protein